MTQQRYIHGEETQYRELIFTRYLPSVTRGAIGAASFTEGLVRSWQNRTLPHFAVFILYITNNNSNGNTHQHTLTMSAAIIQFLDAAYQDAVVKQTRAQNALIHAHACVEGDRLSGHAAGHCARSTIGVRTKPVVLFENETLTCDSDHEVAHAREQLREALARDSWAVNWLNAARNGL